MIDRYTKLRERSHLFSVFGVAGGPRLYKASRGPRVLPCLYLGEGSTREPASFSLLFYGSLYFNYDVVNWIFPTLKGT